VAAVRERKKEGQKKGQIISIPSTSAEHERPKEEQDRGRTLSFSMIACVPMICVPSQVIIELSLYAWRVGIKMKEKDEDEG
jgi:hypothetical protein